MAMEIVIQQVMNVGDEVVSSVLVEDLTAGREKDSGHWSVDYTLPSSQEKEDEEVINREVVVAQSSPSGSTSSLSDESLDSYVVNEENKPELDVVVVKVAADEESTVLPVAPPVPPMGWSLYKRVAADEDNSVPPVAPPVPPMGWSLYKRQTPAELTVTIIDPSDTPTTPTPAPAQVEAAAPVDESQCCIVCFDPNVVTEYDDFNYDYYMDIHHVENSHLTLPCCRRLICKTCMEGIISSVVDEGRVQISCPHPECDTPFTKAYILSNVGSDSVKSKYNRFLVDVECDGKRKTCPKCCHITEHEIPRKFRLKEADLKIDCEICHQEWCFKCHAPWHKGVSCRQFQKGSKDFKKWTKSKQRGVPNCQKCPTCFVYIQRASGCHHMECNRCNTEFCYDCGNRFLELGIIDHESTLNVWGCPDNYHKDEPIIRNSVRWGYLTAKLSYLAAYPPVLIGACGLLVLGAAVVVPVYIGFKLYNYSQFKKANNRRRR